MLFLWFFVSTCLFWIEVFHMKVITPLRGVSAPLTCTLGHWPCSSDNESDVVSLRCVFLCHWFTLTVYWPCVSDSEWCKAWLTWLCWNHCFLSHDVLRYTLHTHYSMKEKSSLNMLTSQSKLAVGFPYTCRFPEVLFRKIWLDDNDEPN